MKYTSFNNVYVLPVFHQLLRGVLRDFWRECLEGTDLKLLSADIK